MSLVQIYGLIRGASGVQGLEDGVHLFHMASAEPAWQAFSAGIRNKESSQGVRKHTVPLCWKRLASCQAARTVTLRRSFCLIFHGLHCVQMSLLTHKEHLRNNRELNSDLHRFECVGIKQHKTIDWTMHRTCVILTSLTTSLSSVNCDVFRSSDSEENYFYCCAHAYLWGKIQTSSRGIDCFKVDPLENVTDKAFRGN